MGQFEIFQLENIRIFKIYVSCYLEGVGENDDGHPLLENSKKKEKRKRMKTKAIYKENLSSVMLIFKINITSQLIQFNLGCSQR